MDEVKNGVFVNVIVRFRHIGAVYSLSRDVSSLGRALLYLQMADSILFRRMSQSIVSHCCLSRTGTQF